MKRIVLMSVVVLVLMAGCLNSGIMLDDSPQQTVIVAMGNSLNSIQSIHGAIKTSAQVVMFEEGTEVDADSVAESIGMEAGDVEFCCNGVNDADGICEGYMFGDCFECTPARLTVVSDIPGRVRAYCPDSNGPCVIGIKQVS